MRVSQITIDGVLRIPLQDLSDDEHRKLIREYTLKNRDGDPFRLWSIDGERGELILPKSARPRFDGPVLDLRSHGRSLPKSVYIGPEHKTRFVPRIGQAEAVDEVVRRLKLGEIPNCLHGGTLVSGAGSGKTIMGAEIALRLGLSTCVMVHKEFLARQWEDAFRLLSPSIRIGRLQGDRVDFGEDFDVVIAITQSLTNPKRMYPDGFYSDFGFFIGDEIHRYGAEVWHTAFQRIPAVYGLGLTATYRRGDGLIEVIERHLGPVLYTIEESNTMKARIHFVKVEVKLTESAYIQPWNGEVNRGKLITVLSRIPQRNDMFVRSCVRALEANRTVMLISERIAQLEYIRKECIGKGIEDKRIGLYVGGKKQDELDRIAAKCNLILTTYQMSREALNIPTLDTLLLGTPISDPTQSVGRIVRVLGGKKVPVVVDPIDTVGPCYGMAQSRKRYYEEEGYDIE